MSVYTLSRNCHKQAALCCLPAVCGNTLYNTLFHLFASVVNTSASLSYFFKGHIFHVKNTSLRQKAGRCHARKCIGFQTVHFSVLGHHKVQSSVIVKLQCLKPFHRICLHLLCLFFRQNGRTGLNGASGFVFVRVIIKAFNRCDLNDRISYSVHDTD